MRESVVQEPIALSFKDFVTSVTSCGVGQALKISSNICLTGMLIQ